MLDTISESCHGDFDIEVLQQNFLLTIKKQSRRILSQLLEWTNPPTLFWPGQDLGQGWSVHGLNKCTIPKC